MKLHGIKIPHLKNTADTVPIHIPVPKTVTIPMSMHIGKPAEILVKRGDNVKVGQLIGKADGNIFKCIGYSTKNRPNDCLKRCKNNLCCH